MSLENEERNSAYEKLTPQRKQLVDKVMENLEKGNLFWSQGWVSSGAPESAVTGKKYRGTNNLFLSLIAMSENYEDNRWATFKQMEEKGWTFKKDEEGKSAAKVRQKARAQPSNTTKCATKKRKSVLIEAYWTA